MANARIYGDFWTGTKRRKTELFLSKAGHRWPADPARGPMCAAECISRIWSFMDTREDASGGLTDVSDDDLEMEAGWSGKPGLLVEALTSCGWIDMSADGKSRRWHDYGAFNAKAFAVRQNGRGGGRPRDPNSVRSRRGDYDETDETNNVTNDVTNDVTKTKPMTKQSGVRSPESDSEASRPEDGAPGCPRAQPPGGPSAAPRTPPPPTPSSGGSPPVENPAPEDPLDDGSDMAEPAPREARPVETAAQTARRLANVAFEKDLTRKLRLAIPHLLRRWNEVADEIDKEFPAEQFPKRAEWIRYKSFPKNTKIRSSLRARAREALKAGRRFSDDFENALLGVRSMEFWTSCSKGWKPNLESFFVGSKWETKIAAGQQVAEREARDEEVERRKDEAFEMEMNRLSRETGIPLVRDNDIALNGKVIS